MILFLDVKTHARCTRSTREVMQYQTHGLIDVCQPLTHSLTLYVNVSGLVPEPTDEVAKEARG